MQAITLSVAEKRALAEYLSGKPFGAAGVQPPTRARRRRRGSLDIGDAARPGTDSAWTPPTAAFQKNPGMTAADVPESQAEMGVRLPGRHAGLRQSGDCGGPRVRRQRQRERSTPSTRDTGCTHWSFKADARHPFGADRRTARHGRLGTARRVLRRSRRPTLFALDAATGELIWKKSVDTHRFARVTGSVTLHDGKLYVPVSSIEEGPGAQPGYECCTFRGSVVALEAATGDQIWKSYTITEAPRAGREELEGHRAVRARRRGGLERADDRSRSGACSTSAPATRTPVPP